MGKGGSNNTQGLATQLGNQGGFGNYVNPALNSQSATPQQGLGGMMSNLSQSPAMQGASQAAMGGTYNSGTPSYSINGQTFGGPTGANPTQQGGLSGMMSNLSQSPAMQTLGQAAMGQQMSQGIMPAGMGQIRAPDNSMEAYNRAMASTTYGPNGAPSYDQFVQGRNQQFQQHQQFMQMSPEQQQAHLQAGNDRKMQQFGMPTSLGGASPTANPAGMGDMGQLNQPALTPEQRNARISYANPNAPQSTGMPARPAYPESSPFNPQNVNYAPKTRNPNALMPQSGAGMTSQDQLRSMLGGVSPQMQSQMLSIYGQGSQQPQGGMPTSLGSPQALGGAAPQQPMVSQASPQSGGGRFRGMMDRFQSSNQFDRPTSGFPSRGFGMGDMRGMGLGMGGMGGQQANPATFAEGGLAGAAQNMADRGRDGDSMLVHMSPGEVKGLQSLAMAHGGSLSINPDTGLVEASFLKKLLPTLAGAALMATGVGAPLAAGMVGGFETLRTGDIGKGLMAGLGAYGGAGLAGGLSSAGAGALGDTAAGTAFDASVANQGLSGAEAAMDFSNPLAEQAATTARAGVSTTPNLANVGEGVKQLGTSAGRSAVYNALPQYTLPAAGASLLNAATPEPEVPGEEELDERYKGSPYRYNLSRNFQGSSPARPNPYYRPAGLGYAEGGDVKKKEETPTYVAGPTGGSDVSNGGQGLMSLLQRGNGMGLGMGGMGSLARTAIQLYRQLQDNQAPVASVAGATQGTSLSYEIDPRTGQVYRPRGLGYAEGGMATDEPMGDEAYSMGGVAAYASGGNLKMKTMSLGDGIYRDTDDDTASLGAYDAAMKRMEKQYAAGNLKPTGMPKGNIAKLGQMKAMASGGLGSYSDGGRMLKGPGDGMSDSIPGVIGNKQPARLADGEFVVPADVVSHLGNGSTDAGAKKLYSMMDKVRSARTGNKKQGKQIKPEKYIPT